jgi:hypothetical protein
MKLSKETLSVLKQFATINTNIVIKPGTKFSTMSASKDIMSEFEGSDQFDKQISIFNLNEFLGVVGSFESPELDLDDKFLTVKEDKQKVKYIYADESLLTTPSKSINMPKAEVVFDLSASQFAKIQKMAAVLAVEDLAFIGDGKKIIARVFDSKNPTGNQFDIDLETKTAETFNALFKVEKMKLLNEQDFNVEISSKKISKFTCTGIKLTTFIAVETSSTFN